MYRYRTNLVSFCVLITLLKSMAYQTTYTKITRLALRLSRVGLLFALPCVICTGQPQVNNYHSFAELIGQWPAEKVRQSLTLLVAFDPNTALAIPCLPPVGFW